MLHLIDSEGMYGIEHVLLDLLPGLHKLGISVLLGCLSPMGSPGSQLGRELIGRGVSVVFLDERKKISARVLFAIRHAVREAKINVIHAHGYKATVLGGIVSFLLGLPFVSTCHGEAAGHPEVSRYVRIESLFLRRAGLVVAVSKKIGRELVERGVPEGNIQVVHNGLSDRFQKERGSGNSRKYRFFPHILCAGRLVPVKRHDLLIDAFHRLRKTFFTAGLTIAGDGPLAEALKERAMMLGLASTVMFPGFVSDLAELYRSADIFVLSSDSEGTPITLLEAMSASLPIVATTVGSIPDLLVSGRDALLVPPDDIGALEGAIASILSDAQLRERLGANARRRFTEIFGCESMTDSYVRCYQSLLS